MACVSTTLAVPSPSMMCITMVRAVRAGEFGPYRHAPGPGQAECHVDDQQVLMTEASSSTTRCEKAYG